MKKALLFCLFLHCFDCQAAVDRHLLDEMLTTVHNEYLEKIDYEKLVAAGVEVVHELEPTLVVSKGSNQFYIYKNHQIYKIVPFPKDVSEKKGWVETLAQILDTATQNSEKISIKDFALPDMVMQKMTTVLDEYSHYYSEFEYKEEDENNAIYTLYIDRMIDNVLYIRMRIFNKQSAKQVEKSIKEHQQISGIILDLRSNSGGMFNEALKIADLFTEESIITYTAGRGRKNIHYYTSNKDVLYDGPLVILVDGKTASAAEVLAGGLQEQSRAKIVGTTTFGKGTIQNVTTMSNGGKLVLTSEQFFTPSGKKIHKKGITPDKCLSLEEDVCQKENRLKNDEDIEEALKLLKNEI